MSYVFVGNVEELSLEELDDMIREYGSRLNPMLSLDIQNEIIKRRGYKYDI